MSNGDRGFIDMIVAANVPYSINLESENSGTLANSDPSDSSKVPYSILVDSSLIDLSGGSALISSGTNPTPVTGNRHSIEIEILDIDSASSGSYEDIIHITVTAR